MRFQRLQIPAYGPFTEFTLPLLRGESDFHILFGPNEAGKSSLLRAIRGLLFGIPSQTTDNFRHDYARLRILADLERSDGGVQTFQRRKGNKNTLLDEAGNAIPEASLTPFRGSVDEAYFDSMFGLDGDQLRAGADHLLRGQGRLGEALFSASMGGTPVDQVIRELEAEAAEIFAGRAQRRIRLALGAHADHLRRKREMLVKPEEWEQAERELREAETTVSALLLRQAGLTNRSAWLERCTDALEMVGKLRDQEARLNALPALPDLPGEFAGKIRAARSLARDAQKTVQALTSEIAQITGKQTACQVDGKVLKHSVQIDRLHTDLGGYRAAKKSLLEKQADAQSLQRKITAVCQDLGLTGNFVTLERFRVTQVQLAEAERKAEVFTSADQALSTEKKRIAELETRIANFRQSAGKGMPEGLDTLQDLLKKADKLSDIASTLASRSQRLRKQEQDLAQLRLRLPGAPADLAEIRQLSVPLKSTIERFRKQFEETERLRVQNDHQTQETAKTITALEAGISRLQRQRDLPTLADLKAARKHRDRGWELVLQEWKGDGPGGNFVEGQPLETAYPDAVEAADHIADRLRLEAEAVAQLEEKQAQLTLRREELQALDLARTHLEEKSQAENTEWLNLWASTGIPALSPLEMIEWRETWEEFLQHWDQAESDRAALESDRTAVLTLVVSLRSALGTKEESFETLHPQIATKVRELDDARVQFTAAQSQLTSAETEHGAVKAKLAALLEDCQNARLAWDSLKDKLALPPDLPAQPTLALLYQRRDLFRDFDLWQAALQESENLSARIASFETEVKEVGAGSGLPPMDPEVLERTLWEALQKARKEHEKSEGLRENLQEKTEHLASAQSTQDAEAKTFADLLTQAGLADETALDPFITQLETTRDHREKIAALRESLAGLARGEPINDFVAKVDAEGTGGIEGQRVNLADELQRIGQDLESAKTERHACQIRLAGLEKAGDEAARSEQEARFEAEKIKADARRFLQLRLAISLLREQIDTFREQNQGPFLERASHWFGRLTGGAFEGITASYAAGDEPTISGRRARGGEVAVAGMSEGTRDQLYLALRLGGLELHLRDHEPMPLILDDLLVHFDDSRTTNALHALAEMASHCQILLFTHHRHVLELAQKALPKEKYAICEISSASPVGPLTSTPAPIGV